MVTGLAVSSFPDCGWPVRLVVNFSVTFTSKLVKAFGLVDSFVLLPSINFFTKEVM